MTDRILIHPGIVPIRVLSKLTRVGVHTTAQVHEHIRNGTLQTLPGIGPKWEWKIIYYYSDPAPGPGMSGGCPSNKDCPQ
jgi:hypothetical protein